MAYESTYQKIHQHFGELPSLTWDEECKLIREAQKGNLQAMDKLCKANLKYIISVSNEYKGFGLQQDDLLQAAIIGFIQAIRKFNFKMSTKLITYADYHIRGNIIRDLENIRTVRIPKNKLSELRHWKKQKALLENIHGRAVSDYEVSKHIFDNGKGEEKNYYKNRFSAAINLQSYLTSLNSISNTFFHPNTPTSGNDENDIQSLDSFEDNSTLSPEKTIQCNELKKSIKSILATLEPIEKKVIQYRFGINLAYSENLCDEVIGDKIGISSSEVNEIFKKAIIKLRRHPDIESLHDLFDH